MIEEDLVFVGCSDVSGKIRGKSFPAADLEKRLIRGVGWTPSNVQINCFDGIAPRPFGVHGDVYLVPDANTGVEIDFQEGGPAEHFYLGDIKQPDGTPWHCCTRSILRDALARLKRVAGVELLAAFEHEFHFADTTTPPGSAYSYSGFRTQRAYGEELTAVMRAAGIEPDTFMKEYGVAQYEVTMVPAIGLRAADNAVILRELARTLAERRSMRASFTPLRAEKGVGNGVHIHMSFRDKDGNPTTFDESRPHGLSDVAGSFVAGILKYLDSIIAIVAPSVISYTRLTPHRWSAAFNNLGYRDREAAIRICPVSDASDIKKAAQFNFEFRAADSAASPHLQLAALIHAGAQGIEEKLTPPEATQEDLALLTPDELAKRHITRLPANLEEALEKFYHNETVTGWFKGIFAEVYYEHKLSEIAHLKGRSAKEIFELYEMAY